MLRSFPSIRFELMVGIGGGAPSPKHDIQLGGVVVSSPVRRIGGVIHYEFGKTVQNRKFERTGVLDALPVRVSDSMGNTMKVDWEKGAIVILAGGCNVHLSGTDKLVCPFLTYKRRNESSNPLLESAVVVFFA